MNALYAWKDLSVDKQWGRQAGRQALRLQQNLLSAVAPPRTRRPAVPLVQGRKYHPRQHCVRKSPAGQRATGRIYAATASTHVSDHNIRSRTGGGLPFTRNPKKRKLGEDSLVPSLHRAGAPLPQLGPQLWVVFWPPAGDASCCAGPSRLCTVVATELCGLCGTATVPCGASCCLGKSNAVYVSREYLLSAVRSPSPLVPWLWNGGPERCTVGIQRLLRCHSASGAEKPIQRQRL